MSLRKTIAVVSITCLVASAGCGLEAAVEGGGETARAPSATGAGGAGCLAGVLCAADSALYRSEIGAWYTLWWHPGGTGEKNMWDASHTFSRYAPLAGYYRSGDASFEKHLAQFGQMKLDFLLLDHTNGLGLQTLWNNSLELRGRLEKQARIKQSVAIGAQLWAARCDAQRHQQEADRVFSHFGTRASAFRHAGKPLLVTYTGAGCGDDWADPRFFNGAANGHVSAASAIQRSRGMFGWVFDDPTPIDARVMGVTPGWNTSHIYDPASQSNRKTKSRVIARGRNGEHYQRQWLRAMRHDPELIVIASWNDFAEETAIEPARRRHAGCGPWCETGTWAEAERWQDWRGNECPRLYFDITRTYALMRWGLRHGAYVREDNDSKIFVVRPGGLEHVRSMSDIPACQPIVRVPDGYLGRFATGQPVDDAKTLTYSGPGGSLWTHKARLGSDGASRATFVTSSTSRNSALTPVLSVFPEVSFSAPKTLGVTTCAIVGTNVRTNATTRFTGALRACARFGSQTWQVSFYHKNDRTPLQGGATVYGSWSASHGAITLEHDGVPASPCQPVPKGLFKVGADLYYSNGSRYCYFPNMATYTRCTGKTNSIGVDPYPSLPAPSCMKKAPDCRC